MNETIFLGGTCNGSLWRDALMPLLNKPYFNPVVANWTPECQEEEICQRETCGTCLYAITPKMTGFFSIAEVTDDSNKRPSKTFLCVIEKDGEAEFTPHQKKSLTAIIKLVAANGGKTVSITDFSSIPYLAEQLNK